ncbi:Fumarylacetoacetase [Pseudocercospora fuligena]|uniref:Fumarylacetoacetase n=1 Tax=Pseudocercospora fuligena TaxID=685502 RepID=A0A8H6VM57_9PEZI|nr:Fumarylacetoacetase [Pseudocercospora fuligena]
MTTPSPGYAAHFGVENIPYGIASTASHRKPTCVTRFEDNVIFLATLFDWLSVDGLTRDVLTDTSLNEFAALPSKVHEDLRKKLQVLINKGLGSEDLPSEAVMNISEVTMHLPFQVGDFTDFSCSHHHVQNASEAMTGQRSAPPAFFHFPVGYAGRCSSIDVSGTPVQRPLGQHWSGKPMQSDVVFGPCERMDYELELGAIIGKPLARNQRILAEDSEEHIFGYVLINDWSARDIQALEMIPLGPLNGKNAGTTMSPWVITKAALASFKTASPARTQPDVAYLKDNGTSALDIKPRVDVISAKNGKTPQTLCQSNSSWMHWTLAQCLAHQAIGGCGLRTGDLLATGTVSGGGNNEHGCLLEFMKVGTTPPRGYLEDGETVVLSGYCGDGVGFGECIATLLPAKNL